MAHAGGYAATGGGYGAPPQLQQMGDALYDGDDGASMATSARTSVAPLTPRDDWSRQQESDKVRVVVRIRPMVSFEFERGDSECLKAMPDGKTVQIALVGKADGAAQRKAFTFSRVFGPSTAQSELFERCGVKRMINSALDGYSATVFAYGQTGAGKTFTMTGDESSDSSHGMIPRAVEYVFNEIGARSQASTQTRYTVRASYLEIYNEQIFDLLNPTSGQLGLRWARHRGFYVENLFLVECENFMDLMAVVMEGISNRAKAPHAMNAESSRSHSMLVINIDAETTDPFDGQSVTRYGKLTFVDLAGSERLSESKSEGQTKVETGSINKSLFTLGNVIAALGDARKAGQLPPYRDSKLTKLLMDSLGGDSLTLMVACCSPSVKNGEVSASTLSYARRAKNIKNAPVVHMDERDQLIADLKREVSMLRKEVAYLKAGGVGGAGGAGMGSGASSALNYRPQSESGNIFAAQSGFDPFPARGTSASGGQGSRNYQVLGPAGGVSSPSAAAAAAAAAAARPDPKQARGRSDTEASGAGGTAALFDELAQTKNMLREVMMENNRLTHRFNVLQKNSAFHAREFQAMLAENESMARQLARASDSRSGSAGGMPMHLAPSSRGPTFPISSTIASPHSTRAARLGSPGGSIGGPSPRVNEDPWHGMPGSANSLASLQSTVSVGHYEMTKKENAELRAAQSAVRRENQALNRQMLDMRRQSPLPASRPPQSPAARVDSRRNTSSPGGKIQAGPALSRLLDESQEDLY